MGVCGRPVCDGVWRGPDPRGQKLSAPVYTVGTLGDYKNCIASLVIIHKNISNIERFINLRSYLFSTIEMVTIILDCLTTASSTVP